VRLAADTPDELLARLCADLRLLWTQAGGPSLRRLADRTGLGKSQVGAILAGEVRSPPDWDVVRALVASFHGYAAEHGRLANLSLRTGVDEHWRPRYAVLEHAFREHPRRTADRTASDRATSDRAARDRVVPRQLPGAMRQFAGRTPELARLTALLDEDAGATVVITAIDGTAGIGKTTLAVHWAHRIADRFPDGQLYVNLRGFDASGPAMTPAEAIRGFLDAFAVPPDRIPVDLQAQSGLYRSLLAGRRVLVLLDNARDADQVRPLLPGTPGCVAVVTSRHRLTTLVTADGAHPLPLDLLSTGEARELLASRIGRDRAATEPETLDELIELCARLPLALALVAARAETHPAFPLAALAGELRDAHGRLDAIGEGDVTSGVRAVISWSYERLDAESARLFRLLGMHPGPDLAVPAAASLAGVPVGRARAVLAELARAHLVEEYAPGRFACHDLLRLYARELADTKDSAPDRHDAVHRLLDHYVHAAHTATELLQASRGPLTLPPPQRGVAPTDLATEADATAWFDAEHAVLLAAVRGIDGFDTHTWQLAWTLTTYLGRRGRWRDLAEANAIGLAAARRLGDPVGQIHAHRGLGRAYTLLGRYDDAHDHLRRALELSEEIRDRTGSADISLALSWVLDLQDRHREALGHSRRAYDRFVAAGDRLGQARALNSIGWLHALLGEHRQAIADCQRALAVLQDLGDRHGEAATWDSLGFAQHRLGEYQQAVASYQNALQIHRELREDYDESMVLDHLGDTYRACGRLNAARTAWRDALSILDLLDHPDAKRINAKLAELDESA
jgi:tetratricopeptide (TPR) repeat protein